MTLKLGLVGLGKIAKTQHLPAIAATDGIDLAAIASRNATLDGLPGYSDIAHLLAAEPEVDAISLCTPPEGRFEQAVAAIGAGKHLMLEKPPGATVGEVMALTDLAAAKGVTLFATWHSREAAAVEAAREFLAGTRIRAARVSWKEDVRLWHPGQQWIWEPGGLGVFDPGINALSIVTRLFAEPLRVEAAELSFPENRETPIAASLAMRSSSGIPVSAVFDWRQTGPQSWNIEIDTDAGLVALADGGARLLVDGAERLAGPDREYQGLYRRFVALVAAGESDVDLSPLRIVSDAYLLGSRKIVEAFED